jgi:hypothetical protein
VSESSIGHVDLVIFAIIVVDPENSLIYMEHPHSSVVIATDSARALEYRRWSPDCSKPTTNVNVSEIVINYRLLVLMCWQLGERFPSVISSPGDMAASYTRLPIEESWSSRGY